ncbi:MAG: cytochrome c [Ignavibacteria bacterium]|nr:cytochrome c [Ignavibacteria bacterium]
MKTIPLTIRLFITAFLFSLTIYSCGIQEKKEVNQNKTAESLKIDADLAAKGRFIYTKKCMECHSLDIAVKGPALRDVTKRRKAEWIMMMILKPEEMLEKDSVAKSLFGPHMVKMTTQDVSEEDAKALLEFFRSVETK